MCIRVVSMRALSAAPSVRPSVRVPDRVACARLPLSLLAGARASGGRTRWLVTRASSAFHPRLPRDCRSISSTPCSKSPIPTPAYVRIYSW
ncbi:hypothetical protein PUN28_014165 [Cardiocondyla obscurior]|uniref:Uncharacterized protein n=1 Tax=Cardiocondyla obscurior TaxID=286306 RepID=A0AAW2F2I1_9HYME